MGKNIIAFDFGASSGRAVFSKFDGSKIITKELHRFSNDPVMVCKTFYWDVLRLFFDIKTGLSKAANSGEGEIASVGIDTWGVDFGLLDNKGRLLSNPVHYRDLRTEGLQQKVFEKISKEKVYSETGIQFMDLNTIYQLYSMVLNDGEQLEKAKDLLFIPDLFNYFLTGQKATEYSIASTSQLLNAHKADWSHEIIDALSIPKNILGSIVDSGTMVGKVLPDISSELRINPFNVYAVAGHDTASAVAAVPASKGENYAYLSCGTWSLMGLELDKPIINETTYEYNFTNEGGFGKKIRFLKNIIGLWLMQEARRQWIREGKNLSFADIDVHTEKAASMKCFINPDYAEFNTPGDMPNKIAKYCKSTNQFVPTEIGEVSRCITESLALKYRKTLNDLESINSKKIDVLRIIGGGVQDSMLCQFTANAIKRPVIAGPIEATALGNIAVQLIANGEFKNIDEARQAIKQSFPEKVYEPQDTDKWDDAFDRYEKILKSEGNC